MGSIFCYFFCWVWWVLYPAKLCFQAIFCLFLNAWNLLLGKAFKLYVIFLTWFPTTKWMSIVFLFFCWLKNPWLFIYHHLYKLYNVLKFLILKLHTTIKIIYSFQKKTLHLFCGHSKVIIVFLLVNNCLFCHCIDWFWCWNVYNGKNEIQTWQFMIQQYPEIRPRLCPENIA